MKTLNTVVDIWRKDSEGNDYCAHQGVVLKKNFDLRFIYPEEVLKSNGKAYKTKCMIFDDLRKESNLLKMGYNEVIKLKEDLTGRTIIGFKK